ncbi:MAG: uroporphyrinogen decarboxylase family protein [Rectinemataceae bacterium]
MSSSKKEAFRRSLAREVVLPVPFSIKFTVEARERYAAFLGRGFDEVEDLGSYVVASHTNGGWIEVKPGYFKDYFGVVWNKTIDRTLGVVAEKRFSEPSFGDYAFPKAENLPVFAAIRADNRKYPDAFHMLSIGFALFERAWSLTGMEELMVWMLTEPAFIHELLDRITSYNVALINAAADIGGIDCVHLGDDWGSQRGPLVSPEMWREFIKPRLKKTCDAIKSRGLYVSLHCCGNIEALMPDVVECGVDVFDPFQPEAMDIWQLHRRYGDRMAFWGGLSVQSSFPFGTAKDIRDQGERLLREMGRKGGYILAPSHALTGDIPPRNISAFIELARSQLA